MANKKKMIDSGTVPTDMNNIPYTEETIEGNIDEVMDKVIHPVRKRIREEVLDELWAAPKLNHEGHWYIRCTDVINIISGEE
jgi:urease alpha subunit